MQLARKTPVLAACVAALALGAPTAALADDGVTTTEAAAVAQDLNRAVDIENAPAATGELPSTTDDGQLLIGGTPDPSAAADPTGDLAPPNDDGQLAWDTPRSSNVTLELPVTGDAVTVDGLQIYPGERRDNEIAVQSIVGGARALVFIDSAAAPERYAFSVGGEAAKLRENDDRTITILGADNEPIGTIHAPWARDANGADVPTRYEIDGLTLTQVVEHRGADFAYGITADPAVISWNRAGWRFGHENSKRVFRYLVTGATAAIGGVVCFAIVKIPAVAVGCGAIVGAIAQDIGQAAAERALRDNKCLEAGVRFFPTRPYAKITRC